MFKIKTTRKARIHFIANCDECDWRNEDYKNGDSAVRKHVQTTGHTVTVDEGFFKKVSKHE